MSSLFDKTFIFTKHTFVNKVHRLYKRIHQHFDRQRFDWKK